MTTKRAAQRRASPRRPPAKKPVDAAAVPSPAPLHLSAQELIWLLQRLEQIAIPSAEGKMICASIQTKGMALAEQAGLVE